MSTQTFSTFVFVEGGGAVSVLCRVACSAENHIPIHPSLVSTGERGRLVWLCHLFWFSVKTTWDYFQVPTSNYKSVTRTFSLVFFFKWSTIEWTAFFTVYILRDCFDVFCAFCVALCVIPYCFYILRDCFNVFCAFCIALCVIPYCVHLSLLLTVKMSGMHCVHNRCNHSHTNKWQIVWKSVYDRD